MYDGRWMIPGTMVEVDTMLESTRLIGRKVAILGKTLPESERGKVLFMLAARSRSKRCESDRSTSNIAIFRLRVCVQLFPVQV
jgi:hypothetical protein